LHPSAMNRTCKTSKEDGTSRRRYTDDVSFAQLRKAIATSETRGFCNQPSMDNPFTGSDGHPRVLVKHDVLMTASESPLSSVDGEERVTKTMFHKESLSNRYENPGARRHYGGSFNKSR